MEITVGKTQPKANNKEKMGRVFGITELAEIFQVSQRSMYAMVERLHLPRIEGLKKVLIYEWELDQWFRDNSRKRRKFARS